MNVRPFQDLSDILEDELERQERLLRLVRAQREAIVSRDAHALDARTNDINQIVAEAAAAESARHAVLREIVDMLQLPVSEQTMSHIAEHAPVPHSERLEFQQGRLQNVMTECHELIYENARRLRRAAHITNDYLMTVTGNETASLRGYSQGGSVSDNDDRPNVVNQRG